MAKPKPKLCFNCGEAAIGGVQTREIRGTTYLCREKACWDAYYKKADAARADKAGKASK